MVKGIYLTLLVGPAVPVPVPQMLLDALTGVEVNVQDGQPSSFQLSFALNNRSPLHTLFLLASGQPLPRVRVIIVVTLNGIPNVLADGVVTNQQVVPGSDGGHSTLAIRGEDLTNVMNEEPRNGTPYPNMTIETRVTTILARYAQYGVIPAVIPSFVVAASIQRERIPAQRGTDLAYLQELAKKVGHVFFVEPGPAPGSSVAYFGPRVKVSPPQPALNVNMDAHTNVESLSFSFEGRDRTQPILRIQEETSGEFLPVFVPDTTVLTPPLGAVPPAKVRTEIIDEAGKLTMNEAILRALGMAAASVDTVTGQGSLDVLRYGRILKARRLVGVRGAGIAFDGLHYVSGVSHSIKPGQYKQQFTLSRNGLLPTVPVVPT